MLLILPLSVSLQAIWNFVFIFFISGCLTTMLCISLIIVIVIFFFGRSIVLDRDGPRFALIGRGSLCCGGGLILWSSL